MRYFLRVRLDDASEWGPPTSYTSRKTRDDDATFNRTVGGLRTHSWDESDAPDANVTIYQFVTTDNPAHPENFIGAYLAGHAMSGGGPDEFPLEQPLEAWRDSYAAWSQLMAVFGP